MIQEEKMPLSFLTLQAASQAENDIKISSPPWAQQVDF